MPIPISESINVLCDRLETVLQAELPTYATARTSADYPLDAPAADAFIVGDEKLEDATQHLGWPDVFCVIVYQPSDLEDWGSGDPTVDTYNQVTRVAVSLVIRSELGVSLPTRNGRELTLNEWMRIRAEKLRGILLDVLPKHGPDGVNITQLKLDSAGVSSPIRIDDAIYREASVVIQAVQDVEVFTRA